MQVLVVRCNFQEHDATTYQLAKHEAKLAVASNAAPKRTDEELNRAPILDSEARL